MSGLSRLMLYNVNNFVTICLFLWMIRFILGLAVKILTWEWEEHIFHTGNTHSDNSSIVVVWDELVSHLSCILGTSSIMYSSILLQSLPVWVYCHSISLWSFAEHWRDGCDAPWVTVLLTSSSKTNLYQRVTGINLTWLWASVHIRWTKTVWSRVVFCIETHFCYLRVDSDQFDNLVLTLYKLLLFFL